MTRWFVLLVIGLSAVAARADNVDHPVTLWRVEGNANAVYLLGSIHLLRADDHPLPNAIDEAYLDAEIIVMELDMDDLDPVHTQMAYNNAGVMKDGTTLRDLMGDERYRSAEEAAALIDVPLEMLARSEPWLAAVTVELMMLYRLGFDPMLGVEMTITSRARRDGKPIEGLETVDEQLGFLDGLPLEAQREMLLQALLQGAELEESIDTVIDAWHRGDTAMLEEELLRGIGGQQELHDALIVDRNRRWANTIEDWLDDDEDYLVVVGALHLVGNSGVPSLLERAGFEIRQLKEQP